MTDAAATRRASPTAAADEFVAAMCDWTWETDAEGRIVFVSPEIEGHLAPAATGYVGRTWPELAQAADQSTLAMAYRDLLDARRPFRDFALFCQSIDGEAVKVTLCGAPVFDDAGTCRGYRGGAFVTTQRVMNVSGRLDLQSFGFQAMVDSLPIMLAFEGLDGTYRVVNRAFATWHDTTPEAIVGKRLHDLIGPNQANGCIGEKLRRQVVETGEVASEDITSSRRQTADQMPMAFKLIKFPIRNANGALIGVGTARIDLTELKASQASVEHMRSMLQSITENVPILLSLKGLDGRLQFVNRRYAAWLNSTPEALIGVDPYDIVDPEVSAEHISAEEEMFRTGAPVARELASLMRPSGAGRHINYIKFPIVEGEHGIVGVGTAVIDVTEQKRAEAAVRESEAQFRSLFENAPLGLTIKDGDGRYVAMNPRYLAWKGWRREDVVGKQAADIYPPETAALIDAEDARVLNGGGVEVREIRMTRVDGPPLAVTVIKAPIIDPKGEVTGACCFFVDISDLRATEGRLMQAQKLDALGRLAGGIAHDFNNFLAAILGFADLLLEDLDPASAQYGFARRIEEAGARAKETVGQILAFSRSAFVEMTPIDLNAVAAEAVSIAGGAIASTTRLTIEPAEAPAGAMANAGQLAQALLNLIVNANDAFDGRPGRVRIIVDTQLTTVEMALLGSLTPGPGMDADTNAFDIRSRPDGTARLIAGQGAPRGDYVAIRVEDDGPGMDEAVLARACDPFFTTKGHGRGSGLGLAVVHGVVAAAKGWLVATTRPGAGAAFTIYLPKAPATAFQAPAATPDGSVRGHGRVLFVDDETDLVDAMSVALERRGFEVAACSDALEALEAFEEEPGIWHAVVTDQNMPGLTGDALVRRIKQRRPGLPCVIYTGLASSQAETSAQAAGADAVLRKPTTADHLARTLVELIDAAQPASA